MSKFSPFSTLYQVKGESDFRREITFTEYDAEYAESVARLKLTRVFGHGRVKIVETKAGI